MIDITLQTTKDGHYHTKVDSVPNVGDSIKLISYTNQKNHDEWNLSYTVTKIEHALIEIDEGNTIVKEHHQTITVYCK
jgi:hypothetical protein